MNRFTKRLALSYLAVIVALSLAPLPAYAEQMRSGELAVGGLSTQEITSEAVGQTDATTKTVTIEWGIPDADGDPNKTIYSYLISWGEKEYTKKAVVPYGDGTVREYKIKGLKPDTTYKVRVGYRYQDNTGEADTWRNVDEWVTCEARTISSGTTGPSGWDYSFVAWEDYTGNFNMEVAAANATRYEWRSYQWAAMPGPFKESKAEAFVNQKYPKNVVGSSGMENYEGKLSLNWGQVPAKCAVVGVGIRTKLALIGGPVYGAWRTKALVADPRFETGSSAGNTMKVTIPPLKYAQSYTIYVGKVTKRTSTKVTVKGWKKAATVGANPDKSVSAVIGKYGKKKLHGEYGVKVVTHTKYGNSPGNFRLFWHS